MTGATSVEMERPNPASAWLSDKAWTSILELGRVLPAFKGFDTDFEKYIHEWERVYTSLKP
jgi:dynein heavy chain